MIACRGLTVRYGEFTALDDLHFEVGAGEICALLGPNGAGKSTTLKVLAGFAEPSAGEVSIDGQAPAQARQRIGVMPESLALFEDLTIEEHLRLTARMHGAPLDRIGQLLRVLKIEPGRGTLARHCSHGMRKKTSFAMALLHNPRVLLLDEPFEAVDPASARMMFNLLRDASRHRGLTVLLTSHILTLVERLADRFVLLRGGKLVMNEPAGPATAALEEVYFRMIEPPGVETPGAETLEWLGSSAS